MVQIDDYQFGRIVVDGHEETSDLVILPTRIVRNWWRREGHSLVVEDLEDVLDELPGHLLIGTGAHGRLRSDPKAIQYLQERGLTVEDLPTGEAVRRYKELDPAQTAAALHLTC